MGLMLGWEPAADHPKVTDAAGLAQVELVELIHKGLFFPRNPSETSHYRPYTGLALYWPFTTKSHTWSCR